jgi:hypothetical protein
MNLPPANLEPSRIHPLASTFATPSAVPKTLAVPAVAESRQAANDAAAETKHDGMLNPLSVIAIGMACFFGVSALVMAIVH